MTLDLAQLRQDLLAEEGLVLHVYDDATGQPIEQGSRVMGHPTIGVGRLITGDAGISRAEALYLLDNDITKTIHLMDAHMPWWHNLPPDQQRAMIQLAFQMGVRGLLGFEKMLAALQAGDAARAAEEALDSRWARQTPARAARIAKLIYQESDT